MRLRELTLREVQRALGAMEQAYNRVLGPYEIGKFRPNRLVLPNSAPKDPQAGEMYWDSESGKIMVYHPDGWESYSKD